MTDHRAWGVEVSSSFTVDALSGQSDANSPTDRVTITRDTYHRVTGSGRTWREAATSLEGDGTSVFRAAGLDEDGSLIGYSESAGPTGETASLRIGPDGRWSSVVESRGERTEAHGKLRSPDQPIKLQRKGIREGAELWRADAVTERTDGSTRRTTGTVSYPGGGTGTFRTDYVLMSDSVRKRESDAGWKPVRGLGPDLTGDETWVDLSTDGVQRSRLDRVITNVRTRDRYIESLETERKEVDGREHVIRTTTDTSISGSTGKRVTTSTSEDTSLNAKGERVWTKETTSVDGSTSAERGVYISGDTAGSVSTSTTHADKSVTITTTTWDNTTWRGEEHSVTTGPNGEVISDTTRTGSIDMASGTLIRPGDYSPIFVPDAEKTDGATSDDASVKEDEGEEGDDKQGDDHEGDDEPGGEETESSGEYGDGETGGYPGLGWDGGDNSPLALLPAVARIAVSRFDDPSQPLDSLGDDTGLAGLLAQAFQDAARRGGTGDAGLGSDVGDPLHGVSEEALARAARVAPTVDPEWGDWTNPKAHAAFVDSVVADVTRTDRLSAARTVATTLNSFL